METLEKQIRELEQKIKELNELKTQLEAKNADTMPEAELKTEVDILEQKVEDRFQNEYKIEEKNKVKELGELVKKAENIDLDDSSKTNELSDAMKRYGLKPNTNGLLKNIDDKVAAKKKEIADIVAEINALVAVFDTEIGGIKGDTTGEAYYNVMKKHNLAKEAGEKINKIYDILDKIKIKSHVEAEANKVISDDDVDFNTLVDDGKGPKPFLKKDGVSKKEKLQNTTVAKKYDEFLEAHEINFGSTAPATPYGKDVIEISSGNLKLVSAFFKKLAGVIKAKSDAEIDATYKTALTKSIDLFKGGSIRSEKRRGGRHVQRGGDPALMAALLKAKFDLLKGIALSGASKSVIDLTTRLHELQAQKKKEEEKLNLNSNSKSSRESKSTDEELALAILSYAIASNKYDDKLLTYCSNAGIDKSVQFQLVFAVNRNQVRSILQNAGIAKTSIMQTIMDLKKASAIKKYKEGWGNYIPGSMGMVPYSQSGINIGVASMPTRNLMNAIGEVRTINTTGIPSHAVGFVPRGTTIFSPSNVNIRY